MDKNFKGFQEINKATIRISDQFFRELLPSLDDINEIKLCLYILWKANTLGDSSIPIKTADILLDEIFAHGLMQTGGSIEKIIENTLNKMVHHKILIKSENKDVEESNIYFINCPKGRKAAQKESHDSQTASMTLDQIQPNIFQQYQENIGPLTPIIADALRWADEVYPAEWIEEAIQIAVQNNVRRWRYVESILDRWQKEGRDGTDRKNDQEDYRRYIKGKYGKIGHH